MYEYSDQNAAVYSKLGIKGTTYEPGFSEAKKIFGDLSGKIVLDYGSGAGRTAKLLLSFGAKDVVGVDHNQSMIDQAVKQNIPHAIFKLKDTTIPYEDNTFDAALCAHVMVEVSSLSEMEQIIHETYRVLKPGGVFVIITNNSRAIGQHYISFQYEKQKNLISGQKIPIVIKGEEHFIIEDYFWFEEDYKKILKKVGFKVKSMTFPKTFGAGWLDEAKVAPHVVITSVK